MALGIKKQDVLYTVFSIPLEWETNEILANHLTYLADQIRNKNIKIMEVRLSSPVHSKCSKPSLEIIAFEKEEK